MTRLVLTFVAMITMTTGAFAGTCSLSKAGGMGVTKVIAMFMSNKALHNMLEKNGEKGVGKVATYCQAGVVFDCISAQKSCR